MNDGPGDRADIGGGGSGEGGGGGGAAEQVVVQHEDDSTVNNDEQGTSVRRSEVPPLFEKLSWEEGRSAYRPTADITTFYKRGEVHDAEREKAQEARISSIVRELRKSEGYYVSDVFNCTSREQANEVCQHLQRNGRSFTRGFLLISSHNEHIHVAHDCSLANGSCRCRFLQKTENSTGIRRRRRSLRRRPVSATLTETDVRNILEYFAERKEGRKIENLQVRGYVERQQAEVGVLEDGGPDGHPAGGRVEERQEDDDAELRLDIAGRALCYGGYTRHREENKEASKSKRRKADRVQLKTEAILKKLQMNPMSPIQGLLQHRSWNLDEDFKFIKEDDPQFKIALAHWLTTLVGYSTEEFIQMYTKEEVNLIFAAGVTDPCVYYYNLEDSFEHIMALLNFQFNNDSEAIHCFMTDVFNIVERKLPKLNTMLVISPTSAGKNWFFDMICNFYLNVGHLGNPNRYNPFAFQDAHTRRIIMWNEVNYAPEHIEAMKELLGGDSTNVSVKYKSEIPIYRTPIIMLSNRTDLSIIRDPTFKDRLKIYYWKTAPLLKPLQRKPHPLTVIKLYNMYGK
uniref:NS1 n=1 Tax=uncultured densovirus TaxID=748192 RepID=A0A7M4CBI0_9VIRU|nr:NS1 [uncultured densovirus]